MKIWTRWFDSTKERRIYIKTQKKEARAEGKKLRVLKKSYCTQRCTGRRMYFADLAIE